MGKYILVVLALCVACVVAGVPASDTIMKITYPHPTCLPATLPVVIEVVCHINRTVLLGTVSFMCNCSADGGTIQRWSYVGGVYTSVGNFTSNTCLPGASMYTSVFGSCGGEPYDSYLAHLLEAQMVTTQHGAVNATWGAGLCSWFLGVFTVLWFMK